MAETWKPAPSPFSAFMPLDNAAWTGGYDDQNEDYKRAQEIWGKTKAQETWGETNYPQGASVHKSWELEPQQNEDYYQSKGYPSWELQPQQRPLDNSPQQQWELEQSSAGHQPPGNWANTPKTWQLPSSQSPAGAPPGLGPPAPECHSDPLAENLSSITTSASDSGSQGSNPDWPDNVTTIMIRHIPCKYTQRKLMKDINDVGFLGKYDFFYLPIDPRSQANRGFAFMNLDSPESARRCYSVLHGTKLRHFNSEKVLAVVPADLQGFDANAAHYSASRVFREERNPHHRPLFFGPLPTHLSRTVVARKNAAGSSDAKGQGRSTYSVAALEEKAAATFKKPNSTLPGSGKGWAKGSLSMHCETCNKDLATEHNFCPFCGQKTMK